MWGRRKLFEKSFLLPHTLSSFKNFKVFLEQMTEIRTQTCVKCSEVCKVLFTHVLGKFTCEFAGLNSIIFLKSKERGHVLSLCFWSR